MAHLDNRGGLTMPGKPHWLSRQRLDDILLSWDHLFAYSLGWCIAYLVDTMIWKLWGAIIVKYMSSRPCSNILSSRFHPYFRKQSSLKTDASASVGASHTSSFMIYHRSCITFPPIPIDSATKSDIAGGRKSGACLESNEIGWGSEMSRLRHVVKLIDWSSWEIVRLHRIACSESNDKARWTAIAEMLLLDAL